MNHKTSQNFTTNVSDLLEVQRSSFYRFLLHGVNKELNPVIINPFFLISVDQSIFLSAANKHKDKEFVKTTKNGIKLKKFANFLNKKKDLTAAESFGLNNFENSQLIAADMYLYSSKLKIKGPIKSLQTCLQREETYAANIYIQGQIIQKNKKKKYPFTNHKASKVGASILAKKGVSSLKMSSQLPHFERPQVSIKKYFYLATIPFLSEDGTFFVNGCERVVVNQIIRSPGIYFRKDYLSFQKAAYTATFISDNWVWTKFTLDNTVSYSTKINNIIETNLKEDSSYEKFQQESEKVQEKYDVYINLSDSNFWRELPVSKENQEGSTELLLIDLVLSLGFTIEEIFDNLKYPEKLSLPDILRESSLLQNLKETYSTARIKYGKYGNDAASNKTLPATSPIMEHLLDHIFGETEEKTYFSLGELGRYRVNKRLGLNLPLATKYLTGLDFLKIIDCLIQFREEKLNSDDIDDLKNKQIRGVGDLVQNQFRLALYRWLKHPKYAEENFADLGPKYLLKQSRNNFALKNKRAAIFLNSFTLSSQLRIAISKSLREFFLTSQLSQYFDETNPLAELAHKRRISVFGPDGLQRERVSTKIRDIHPSQYGKICPVETPEGGNAGLIMSLASFARVNQYGWIESPYLIVQDGKVLQKTKTFYLNPHQEEGYKLAFSNNFLDKTRHIINNSISIKEGAYFSEAESITVDFTALSQFQILSIGTILVPFVEHNDANRALMGSNMQRQAVPLLFTQSPFIGTGFEAAVALESGLVLKSESEGLIQLASSSHLEIQDCTGQKIIYKLKKYHRSNQETCNNQVCFFWPGEKIYAGQIITDSSATLNGELALGSNLLIGYLPWEGYNYEDAIVINEKLVTQNILTSLHISTYQTSIKPTSIVLKKINYVLKSAKNLQKFKKLFQSLKVFRSKKCANLKNYKVFKKISRQILGTKQLAAQRFADTLYTPEYLLGKEKVSAYVGKGNPYLTRNLSSNGIIKIGSYVKGGDVLVSKLQIIDGSQPKSSYQKLFEDLQPIKTKDVKQNKKFQKLKPIKNFDLFLSQGEKKKMGKILYHIKFLSKNYFKAIVLFKRLSTLKNLLENFSSEINFVQYSRENTLYLKSLSIKYQTKKRHLSLLLQAIFREQKKKYSLGSCLIRLLKLLTQSFYKKLYSNFYLVSLKKKQKFVRVISSDFKQNLLKTKLKNSPYLLGKIYITTKQNAFKILKSLYCASFENPLFNETKADYSISLFSRLSLKSLENVTFNPKFAGKLAECFFFLELESLHRLFQTRKSFYKKIKLEFPQNINYKDTSFLAPLDSHGKVIDLKILPLNSDEASLFASGFAIKIYIIEMCRIQVGDKLSGRHGNKGVISRVLPSKDMPSLPDGTVLDILVNPLGVPSRMNVGQLLECLLGLSSLYLENKFKVRPFDEIFGVEASRVFVTQKLKQSSINSSNYWLYGDETPGKFYLRDGRTGEFFDNPVTVGVAYILKLIHLVKDKVHSRALGPYNRVTEQPLQGKASNGGQRFGEMEVWALEAYGCANTLQELLTVKSDDVDGRNDLYKSISSGDYFEKPNASFSETLVSLIRELNSLGLDFQFFRVFSNLDNIKDCKILPRKSEEEILVFNLLEERLKLRFKANELKFRYPDFETKSLENNFSNLAKHAAHTKVLFGFLENL